MYLCYEQKYQNFYLKLSFFFFFYFFFFFAGKSFNIFEKACFRNANITTIDATTDIGSKAPKFCHRLGQGLLFSQSADLPPSNHYENTLIQTNRNLSIQNGKFSDKKF